LTEKQGLEAALRDINDLIAITLRQIVTTENSRFLTDAQKQQKLADLRAELAQYQAQQRALEQALNQLDLAKLSPTASAATITAQAQLSRDDNANPGAPAPPVQTVQTADGRIVTKIILEPTNARATPSEETGAVNTGTGATTVPLTVSQSIPSPQPSGPLPFNPVQDSMQRSQAARIAAGLPFATTTISTTNSLQGPPNLYQSLSGISNSGTQVGVGAGNEDTAQPTTNATQNRLSELYGGANTFITPQDNVLDQYSSYTYSLSWYLLDPKTYSNLILLPNRNLTGYYLLAQSGGAPVQNAVPTQTGIAGGGGAGTVGVGRNPYFPLDYYLDNFEYDTYYTATPGSRGASNISIIKFTVTEPNGITLLKNLYTAVTDVYNTMNISKPGSPVNYKAAQYCMVIRFYGYDTEGNLVQPIAQRSGVTDRSAVVEKFVPFTINNITFKVASKLVEYNIEGAGVGQVYNNSTIKGSIPQNFTFNGTTVKDILVGSITQPTASNAAGDQTRNNVPIQSSPPTSNNTVQDPAQRAQATGVTP
jgi:hypothetical protein